MKFISEIDDSRFQQNNTMFFQLLSRALSYSQSGLQQWEDIWDISAVLSLIFRFSKFPSAVEG